MNQRLFVISQKGDKVQKNIKKVSVGQNFVFVNDVTYGVYESPERASQVSKEIIKVLCDDNNAITSYSMPER